MKINLLLFLLFSPMLLAGRIWTTPGSNPFVGTPVKACEILSQASGVGVNDCLIGIKNHYLQINCKQDYLFDGDEVFVTFGKDKVAEMVVLFKDSTEKSLSLYDKRREVIVCPTGDKNYELLFPTWCGNWAIKKIVKYEKPKTTIVVTKNKKPNNTCGFSDGKTTIVPGYILGGYNFCYGCWWNFGFFSNSGLVAPTVQQEFDYICEKEEGGVKW